jgi:hypothetical protein
MLSGGAAAATVTFDFNYEFSSGTSPVGATPWLTATFTDLAPGSVQLVVSTSGLTANEFVSELYFNVDPLLNAAGLGFTRDIASTGPDLNPPNNGIFTATNQYQADGDGLYDILFDLPPPPGQQSAVFGTNETLIYTISGTGLSAQSFYFLSQPAGNNNGPFYAAAHIQRIGTGDASGWVAPVPVPAAVWLLLSGLGSLVAVRKRRVTA